MADVIVISRDVIILLGISVLFHHVDFIKNQTDIRQ